MTIQRNASSSFSHGSRKLYGASLRHSTSLLNARLGRRIPLHVGQLLTLGLGLRRVSGERRSRDAKKKTRDLAVLRILDILFPFERVDAPPKPPEGCALLVAPTCPQLYRSVNEDPCEFLEPDPRGSIALVVGGFGEPNSNMRCQRTSACLVPAGPGLRRVTYGAGAAVIARRTFASVAWSSNLAPSSVSTTPRSSHSCASSGWSACRPILS